MPAFSNLTHLHLWVPDIFESKGGIQAYSAFFLKALQSLYPNIDYNVFLKHDTDASSVSYPSNIHFHFAGAWPLSLRTSAFAAQILGFGIWQRPNLVISTHLNFTVAANLLKQRTGIPYWTIVYGIDAWDIQRPALQTALHHADRILSISSYTRDRLLKEQNLDPDKVLLLPCAFDPECFTPGSKPTYLLKRYGIEPNRPIILTVARLSSAEQYKGYDQIIKALPQIRQLIPNIHYILVGKGDDLSRIEQLILSLQLQHCVTLTGFVPNHELCDHYNLCDVFAMPSQSEGFGIVYLESLACGKPTLGGNRDGAVDALCQGELGVLVDPDDIEEIAKSLIQILHGTYPNPLIYQPEALRQKVIDIFGFEHLKKTLASHLKGWENHF